jgi:hypothetical protein
VFPVDDLGEPDLRVRDPFVLDAAEGSIDEVGPDLSLVTPPVIEVLGVTRTRSARTRARGQTTSQYGRGKRRPASPSREVPGLYTRRG